MPTRLNPHGTAVNNTAQQVSGSMVLYSCYDYEFCNKTKAESLMAHVDPTTFTEATKAMVTQKALLSEFSIHSM